MQTIRPGRLVKRPLGAGLTLARRREHVAELGRLTQAPWDDPERMDARRLASLARTVQRAARTSPFYGKLLGTDPPVPRSWDELAALPVTSKSDVRASGLDRASPPAPLRLRHTWATTGSSGEPSRFRVGVLYEARHHAQRAFVYLRAGLAPGSPIVEMVPGVRYIPPEFTYPTFRRTIVGHGRDDRAALVRHAGPQLLYGNRSYLLMVAEAATAWPSRSIPFVCNSSETLLPQDVALLSSAFSARVLEIYGLAEASNIAYRLDGEDAWTILEPRIIVEVLDEERKPVGPGQVGELVVTTLTEPTAPLIRFATGDLARVRSGSGTGRSGLRLAALEGRAVDSVVDTSGRRVTFSPVASSAFWAADPVIQHVRRWQVHQSADRSLLASIELLPGGDAELVKTAVEAHLHAVLGMLPVTVRFTDRVHDTSAGKFRVVTSECTGS
jgi:phenylacetate-CoA ligase